MTHSPSPPCTCGSHRPDSAEPEVHSITCARRRDDLIAERARAFVLSIFRLSTNIKIGQSPDAAADFATAELLALLEAVPQGAPPHVVRRTAEVAAQDRAHRVALSIIGTLEDWDPMARPYTTPAEMVRAYCVEQGWIDA